MVLTQIYAHELSFSYSRPWRRVVSYNGEMIKSLEHLQDLWTASCTAVSENEKEGMDFEGGDQERELTFVRLELENDDDIVFEVGAAMTAQKEVMATHAIPKPYNILPPNPKYI